MFCCSYRTCCNVWDIIHQFDIFHESVKLNAKLLELGNKRGNSALLPWVPAIRNHFWHSAESCHGNVDDLIETWISVLRHVIGQHIWQDGQCNHDIDETEDTSKYLDPESPAMEGLREIVLDKKKLVNMRYYCHFMHTYAVLLGNEVKVTRYST